MKIACRNKDQARSATSGKKYGLTLFRITAMCPGGMLIERVLLALPLALLFVHPKPRNQFINGLGMAVAVDPLITVPGVLVAALFYEQFLLPDGVIQARQKGPVITDLLRIQSCAAAL